MDATELFCWDHYERVNLVADPIHRYIPFTKRSESGTGTVAEEDLIDSSWVQRLRRIHQLQAAWWVFPSGEHTRFQHSLGTMHVAGEFAGHLYESLASVCNEDIPSRAKVVETARIAGLLHDVGHGPFGHFFDEYYLGKKWNITHETVGQSIITGPLRILIESVTAGLHGDFAADERLSADDIAWLIRKPQGTEAEEKDLWLSLLRSIFCGLYTADSLDYVCRDAYMTGVSVDPVDTSRLMYYTHFRRTDPKCSMVLHLNGVSAMERFLQARFFMYDNIYAHRTVRAIEMEMRDVFEDTIDRFVQENPIDDLERYLALDEWSLIHEVSNWAKNAGDQLGQCWKRIIERNPRWKRVFEMRAQLERPLPMTRIWREDELQREIWDQLTSELRQEVHSDDIRVDIASLHPRPENPYLGESALEIYDPMAKRTTTEPWDRILAGIPSRAFIVRVFSTSRNRAREINEAATNLLSRDRGPERFPTNI
ncbi:MAG: HD domain-containing protein [Chloroflexota bacterium]